MSVGVSPRSTVGHPASAPVNATSVPASAFVVIRVPIRVIGATPRAARAPLAVLAMANDRRLPILVERYTQNPDDRHGWGRSPVGVTSIAVSTGASRPPGRPAATAPPAPPGPR